MSWAELLRSATELNDLAELSYSMIIWNCYKVNSYISTLKLLSRVKMTVMLGHFEPFPEHFFEYFFEQIPFLGPFLSKITFLSCFFE